jgi:hypothetical protein
MMMSIDLEIPLTTDSGAVLCGIIALVVPRRRVVGVGRCDPVQALEAHDDSRSGQCQVPPLVKLSS